MHKTHDLRKGGARAGMERAVSRKLQKIMSSLGARSTKLSTANRTRNCHKNPKSTTNNIIMADIDEIADDISNIRRQFPLIRELPALRQHIAVAAPAAPPPSELHALVAAKKWEAAIERCSSHPNEVSSELRDERGYTVLHSLLAYNRTTDGEELVPLVFAILRAAEDVDFKAKFPLGRVEYDDIYHMKQFYSDIEEIKSDIAAIESATEKIITASQNDKTALALEATKIFNRAENCERKIELLQEESSHIQKELNESKEEKKNTDDLSVREELVNNLQCKFSAELKRYQESLKKITDEDLYAAMSTDRKSGGSSRLLLDQLNRAKWSPLHLVCLQGGFIHGKVPLLRVLLQEHPDSSRQQLLTLLDRQNRNVLHHLLEISEPTDDTFRALHYVIGRDYSLLLQKDDRGKTPLDYVFDHYYMHAGTFRRSNGHTGEARYEKSYLLLKVLVGYLERGELGTYATNGEEVNNDDIIPQNLFHSVCRLPMGVCPELMFKFLYKESASIVKEVDENGNTALHLLLANPSYAGDGNSTSQQRSYRPRNRAYNQRQREFRYVLASNREAIYTKNNSGHLPLRIAMDAGRRDVMTDLIMLNHEAVLLDERLEDSPILIAHILGIVASSSDVLEPDSEPKIVDDVVNPLDTVFKLLRARPDFVSFGRPEVLDAEEERSNDGGKMSWRKKLNPFRLFSRDSKR